MKVRLVWLILCGIWGSTWLFIKLGLEDLPPLTFAGIRFVIACLLLFAFIRFRGVKLPTSKDDWLLLAVTGVLSFTLNYGLLFWGEQFISSGLAAVLQATIPAFGLVIAHFYLPGERMTWARIFGVALGVCGVGIVFSNQLALSGGRALAGCVALVFSSFFVAYSNVLVKARGKNLEPSVIAAGQMFFGMIPLLLVGIPLEGNPLKFHWTLMSVVAMFYLAIVGSVLAFLLYYWLVHNMDVTKSMLIALVTPVVAVVLGMIVLHEELNWRTFAGGAMIILGIGFIVTQRRRKELSELVTTA
ncbi:MAG TPA: EamA family transporter [Pyrinomonadaceae bacterium]|jgi:Permeases of the drug/metabolite transporter (DMT) superfamily|nr:EamA family transporter [Pyrinomonadaceae bacterium]